MHVKLFKLGQTTDHVHAESKHKFHTVIRPCNHDNGRYHGDDILRISTFLSIILRVELM